jgi:hypothetical protein
MFLCLACDSRCPFIDILRLIISIINLIPDVLIRLVCVCSTGFCSSACLLFSPPIWLYTLAALISLLQYAQAFSLPGSLSLYTGIFVANIWLERCKLLQILSAIIYSRDALRFSSAGTNIGFRSYQVAERTARQWSNRWPGSFSHVVNGMNWKLTDRVWRSVLMFSSGNNSVDSDKIWYLWFPLKWRTSVGLYQFIHMKRLYVQFT